MSVWTKNQKYKIEKYVETIAQAADDAKRTVAWQEWAKAAALFYNYSANNALLISWQNPNAKRAASRATWAKLGRTLKSGAKPVYIISPNIIKEEQEDGTVLSVFKGVRGNITWTDDQTEGKPLPEINWRSTEKNAEMETALLKFSESKGIKVSIVKSLGGAEGVSYGDRIELLESAGTRTLIHEIAHELLHDKNERAKKKREVKEIEADGVAAVVCMHFGLDTDASANYLANWGGTKESILERLTEISAAAKIIIDAIEGSE